MSHNHCQHRKCGGCHKCHHGHKSCTHFHNHCNNFGPFIAKDPNCFVHEEHSASAGSIIPFSSGTVPALLVTAVGGLIGTTSLIGFGSAIPGISVVNNQIELLAPLLNAAFSVPRSGNITSISASFRATVAVDLLGDATVNARIYHAPAGSKTFTATDAAVNLTPLSGLLAIDEVVFGHAEDFAPVNLAPGDRLLMVFSVTGPTVATTLTGAASAGINIE